MDNSGERRNANARLQARKRIFRRMNRGAGVVALWLAVIALAQSFLSSRNKQPAGLQASQRAAFVSRFAETRVPAAGRVAEAVFDCFPEAHRPMEGHLKAIAAHAKALDVSTAEALLRMIEENHDERGKKIFARISGAARKDAELRQAMEKIGLARKQNPRLAIEYAAHPAVFNYMRAGYGKQ